MTTQPTALDNVDTDHSTGLTPSANPEVKKTRPSDDLQKRGVREECLAAKRKEFPQEADKQWYVVRATYNREYRAYRYFKRHKIKAYLPMHSHWETDGMRKIKVTRPLLSCMLFVYETEETMTRLVRDTPALCYLRYYYNKFNVNPDGTEKKLTIDYDEMLNFIVVTSVRNPHVKVVNQTDCRFKSGDMVCVTRGDFKGVVGRVARVGGQTCVVVNLEGVCLVATAYIRSSDLEEYAPD